MEEPHGSLERAKHSGRELGWGGRGVRHSAFLGQATSQSHGLLHGAGVERQCPSLAREKNKRRTPRR